MPQNGEDNKMAYDDNDEDKKKQQYARPQYTPGQAADYQKMSQGFSTLPPAFQKIKDLFSKKKQDDESQE